MGCSLPTLQICPSWLAWSMGPFLTWLPFSFISQHYCFTLHSPSVTHFLTVPPMCCVFQVIVTSQLPFSPCRIPAPIYMSMKYWSFETAWLKPSLSTLLVTAPDSNLTLILWSLLLFIITLNTLSCYLLVDMSVANYRREQWLVQRCLRNVVKFNWDQGSFQYSDSRFVTDNLSFCLWPQHIYNSLPLFTLRNDPMSLDNE